METVQSGTEGRSTLPCELASTLAARELGPTLMFRFR